METGTWKVKKGLAQMLKGGVIMDITNPEQAKIAEAAGVTEDSGDGILPVFWPNSTWIEVKLAKVAAKYAGYSGRGVWVPV
jgi:hypothetical protein